MTRPIPQRRGKTRTRGEAPGVLCRWQARACLLAVLLLALANPLAAWGHSAKSADWRGATQSELKALIPARAQVINERIETEFRTASGITDGEGHFIAGVVLITAGYSAEGKYSHYFLTQVPIRIGDTVLGAGQYLIGWQREQDDLKVTFYEALTGKPVANAVANRDPEITRVEEFRIWPPNERHIIQIGRFTVLYTLAENAHEQNQ